MSEAILGEVLVAGAGFVCHAASRLEPVQNWSNPREGHGSVGSSNAGFGKIAESCNGYGEGF